MAVTKPSTILLAALALPGLALADNPPEQASLSVKYLDYKDSQPNLDRVHVRSPSLDLLLPIAGEWSLRAGLVNDAISGASPRYHTAVSGASHFDERRSAADLGVTRYFSRASVSLAAGRSSEHDYVSRYASSQASWSSEDNNSTWVAGVGVANDAINPVNDAVKDERRHSTDLTFGLTQVLGQRDIGQIVLGHVRGRGYFSNPYKYVDSRPREHDQNTVLLRWNHRLAGIDASSRLAYRYYRDNYGVQAHTLSEEVVHGMGHGWTLTPSLRLYSQSAARFYFDPVYDKRFGPPFPPAYVFGASGDVSADQRLSAFGAVTLGLKVAKRIDKDTSVDLKWETYRQKASWRLFGSGSPGLQEFDARSISIGLTRTW